MVFAQQFLRLKQQTARVRRVQDIETVRQLRQDYGRMRRLLKLLPEDCLPQAHREIRLELREISRGLGQVRDLDILMLDLESHLGNLSPGQRQRLRVVVDRFCDCRRVRRAGLKDHFDSAPHGDFMRRLHRFGDAFRGDAGDPVVPHQVRHALPPLLHQCLARGRAYDAVMPDCGVGDLHRLRLEFKQLRYCIEIFRPVLGVSADGFLRSLRGMHDVLGRIQDIVVCHGMVGDLEDLTAAQSGLLEAYRADRLAEQEHRRRHFGELWARFRRRETQHLFSDALLVLR